MISNAKTEQKDKENDVKQKRQAFMTAKKNFKEFRLKKKKADRPVRTEIQNILEKFCISAAAYHGGDLNGVCARHLMAHSEEIFSNIQPYLLAYEHDGRCSDEYIRHFCDLYRSIFATLDVIMAKLHIKSGCAHEDDCMTLERSLKNLQQLWNATNLSHTPKLHALLSHAPKQMRNFKGIGDLLEDDVEKMHQIAGNYEARSSRLKSASGRAVAQAKMEAMSHNNSVQKSIQFSKQLSKRKIDNDEKAIQQPSKIKLNYKGDNKKMALKTERDRKRLKTLDETEQNPISKLLTAYKKLKVDIKKPK
jgi:hypothetical protein